MPEVTAEDRALAAVRLWMRETMVGLSDGVTADDEAALIRIVGAAISEAVAEEREENRDQAKARS